MIFGYANYRTFLVHIRANFPLTTFRDWKGGNGILLRHDVDFDLAAAHRLALLEHEHHVPATFFIRTASPTYNPMSLVNRSRLVEMSAMGFEIGLHFDPSIYGEVSEDALQRRVHQESSILESILERSVDSISLHNPSVHNRYVLFSGYRNAYDPGLFTPEMYISDSRMVFLHNIYQFVERARSSHVQVLLHPLHFTPQASTYPEIVCDLVTEMVSQVDSEFSVNSTYSEQMRGRVLLSRLLERTTADECPVEDRHPIESPQSGDHHGGGI